MAEGQIVQRGFRISGRVQGVFFRVWTRDVGQAFGLSGTVRNLPDGSVEAHVRGPEEQVAELAVRLWEGPPASDVEGVEAFESEVELDTNTFEIRY